MGLVILGDGTFSNTVKQERYRLSRYLFERTRTFKRKNSILFIRVEPMSGSTFAAVMGGELRTEAIVEGYSSKISVVGGETITFFVSSRVPFRIAYVRLSDTPDGVARGQSLLPESSEFPAFRQRVDRNAWSFGCRWKATTALVVPSTWPAGIYAAECRATNGAIAHIVFVVRPSPTISKPILVLANTNTWNSYNSWPAVGAWGSSRYNGRDRFIKGLHFQRPNPEASPVFSDGPWHLTRAELWLHRWLKFRRFEFDVCADVDLHDRLVPLENYRVIILNTHPEYWSREMRLAIRAYLDTGGSLLYLGGNGAFEAVKLSTDRASLVFHDGDPTPNLMRSPFFFRNLPPTTPEVGTHMSEREWLGVAFLHDNYSSRPGPYKVRLRSHWLFNGANITDGELMGSTGYNGGACGKEMDTSRAGTETSPTAVVPAWRHLYPYDPGHVPQSDRGSPPSNLVILAQGVIESELTDAPLSIRQDTHVADMTYYETGKRRTPGSPPGFVFSVGSFNFVGSMCYTAPGSAAFTAEPKLQRIVENAIYGALNGY